MVDNPDVIRSFEFCSISSPKPCSVMSVVFCKKYQFKHGQIGILRPSLSLCQGNSLLWELCPSSGCSSSLGFSVSSWNHLSPQGWISQNISVVTQHSLLLQWEVVHLPKDRSKELQNLFFLLLLSFFTYKEKKFHVSTEIEKALIAIICMTLSMGICWNNEGY